ncbi:DNA glycosylase AlkZ-like family protein [Paenibacillus sp. NPDC093718]|uniref:DNA glycosylase AlkZ-like family protein n=1 Tax=Paenibacillus sp. NPDC093718 TaxID=3390601 RepID=UPI003D05EBA1
MRATFLIDGFVAWTWKLTSRSNGAEIHIKPFRKLTQQELDALSKEGSRMLKFAVSDAAASTIVFI